MALNLIDSFKGLLAGDVTDRMATHLGESNTGVSKAINGAVPAILAGFANWAHHSDKDKLYEDARQAASSNLSNISNYDAAVSSGSSWLSRIFDNNLGGIVGALAAYAGIKNGSVNSLLSMLAPIGLGVIGKHAIDNNLNANSLSSYLTSQKSSFLNALPAGLNLSNYFGGGTTHTTTHDTHRVRTTDVDEPKKPMRILPIILILAAVAILGYLLSRGCNKNEEVATTTDTTTMVTPMDTSTTVTTTTTRTTSKVRLADNTELDAYSGGIEEQLVNCLNDNGCKAGKDKWFDFDNINFEVGSARLTSNSQAQVNNIAAILKAYPKAKIKIGGYTDKTGNEAENKKLSQDRAETVMNALKAAGASAAQLTGAEGYGSQFAKMPATASDEERRSDRRIAVQLNDK
jgi:outer membrane protein OmpA-like peptidoglycan-associated protein